MKQEKKFVREKIPEKKIKLVEELVQDIKNNRTFMLISIKSLPASQFQAIKKKLFDKAKIKMLKKRIALRAIDKIDMGKIKNTKEYIKEDTAILISNIEPFELASILAENRRPIRAKPGQEAVEDITIEAGPTDLPPGPAVSELSGVGLKVSIEDGKINIKEGRVIVKKGERISAKAADVMAKLGIEPFEIGIEPVAVYDSQEDEIYTELKIDKKGTLEKIKNLVGKALALAVNVAYSCKETIAFLLAKANSHEKALEKFVQEKPEEQAEQKTEEKSEEKEKPEETKPDNVQQTEEKNQETKQEDKQEEK